MHHSIETRDLPLSEYVGRFRDLDRFARFCKECGRYGSSWTCPPFDSAVENCFSEWKRILLVVLRIEFPDNVSESEYKAGIRGVRLSVERRLLELERENGGRTFGFLGECLHCGRCARLSSGSCLHPELARPPLEAFGFDIVATLSELFGITLQWSYDRMPRKITLVSALFHSGPADSVSL